MNDDDMEQLIELTEIRELGIGTLSVNVDFNELLHDYDESKTFILLRRLKELLT